MPIGDPVQTLVRVKRMIETNQRPVVLLHQFLSSGTVEANLVANTILENREALKVLTSPAGRRWLWTWFNDSMDYLEQIAKQG